MAFKTLALSVLAIGCMSCSVSASPMTLTYNFDAKYDSGPYSQVKGSFTETFDPASNVGIGPIPLTDFTSNLPARYSPVKFTFINSILVIGNSCFGPGGCGVGGGSDQFFLDFSIDGFGNVAGVYDLPYSSVGTPSDIFSASSLSVTVGVSTVPLPASAPLFGGALLALGLTGFSLHRKQVAAR